MRVWQCVALALALAGCVVPGFEGEDDCPGGIGTRLEYVVWDVETGESGVIDLPIASDPFCTDVPLAALDNGLVALPSRDPGRIDLMAPGEQAPRATLGANVSWFTDFDLQDGVLTTYVPREGFRFDAASNGSTWLRPLPAGGFWAWRMGGSVALLLDESDDAAGLYDFANGTWLSPVGTSFPPGHALGMGKRWIAYVDQGRTQATVWGQETADGRRQDVVLRGYVQSIALDGDSAFVAVVDGPASSGIDRLVRIDFTTGGHEVLHGWPTGALLDAADGQVLVGRFVGPPPVIEERAREVPPQARTNG